MFFWFFFFILILFATVTGNYAFTRLNIIIFVIRRSISVEIDTSLALFQTLYFWRSFWFFFLKRGPAIFTEVTNRSYWFSIANSGRQFSILCWILKKIGQKLRPWESPKEKVQNNRHDIFDFEISKSEKSWPRKYL